MRQIVIDTNVFIASLKSSLGASYRLLGLLPSEKFAINLSPALVYEYQEIARRPSTGITLSFDDIDAAIDGYCTIGNRIKIFYRWRPFLLDPEDDMIVELAVAAQCDTIVTFNKADFLGVEQFGLTLATPGEFLRQIGEYE